MEPASHFISEIIDADLASGKHTTVVTRFPPEPNGFLHIGHAKAIGIDFGMAQRYGGRCHLRFDDTNPAKEDTLYEEAIQQDIRWLGYDWGENLFHASDYFEKLYGYGVELIEKGLAYVCHLSEEEIRAGRGTVTEPGTASPYRDRSVEENLRLFRQMREGEFEDGECVLRGKIDMASPNMKMRDPLFYRIRRQTHHRTGDDWCIYPFYDFAHCLSDSIEGITHSLCSLEFDNNRELYDWILDHCTVPRPQPRQYEFARLKLGYTMMSKRNLLKLVEDGAVSGWDDPRMPTLAAFRRRGVRPEAIRAFVARVGVSKADSLVDVALLEHTIRDDLNHVAPRVMGVVDPIEVELTDWAHDRVEWVDASYWPHDVPNEGSRRVPFTRRLYIDRDDFAVDPPKKWKRLAPGVEVRLRYGYWIRCTGVEHDADGRVVKILATHDPETRGGANPSDGRKPNGTIHWVSATEALPVEFRLYDRLFDDETPWGEDWADHLNPGSLVIRQGWIEPSVADDAADTRYQLERTGYFWRDQDSGEKLVFNRIVPLKDRWAKTAQPEAAPPADKPKADSKPTGPTKDEALVAAAEAFAAEHDINAGDAEALVSDEGARTTFDAIKALGGNPRNTARWVVNELPRVGVARSLEGAAFDAAALAKLLDLLASETLTDRLAKQVLEVMADEGGDPAAIAEARGWTRLDDDDALRAIIDEVIAAHPDQAAGVKDNPRLMGFFVGQVMRRTGGRAAAQAVQALLRERLS